MSCSPCKVHRVKRHRITIERLKSGATVNDYNEIDERDDANWETYISRPADIDTISGMEMKRSGQVQAERKQRFRLDYDPQAAATTAKMRISFDSRKFGIEHVENVDEMNEEVILHCKEKA